MVAGEAHHAVVLSSAVGGDFEVFRPAEATCYTDGGNIKIAYRIVSCRMVLFNQVRVKIALQLFKTVLKLGKPSRNKICVTLSFLRTLL